MLTQYELDKLMQSIQSGQKAQLFYVAHMIEPREGLVGEEIYKSSAKFKIIRIEIKDIKNAYFEYLNYLNNPDTYHIETETCYYGTPDKHITHYIVPNGKGTYELDINPRMPSIIYGIHREVYNSAKNYIEPITDKSPISYNYTNTLTYGDNTYSETVAALNNGKLDWKYKKLTDNIIIDGVEYQYIISDWYVLDIKNFPSVEMPLINVNKKNSYFINLNDALSYMEQLEA